MYKKTVEYKNLLTNQISKKTLYFYITPANVLRLSMQFSALDTTDVDFENPSQEDEIRIRSGISDHIRGVMSRGKGSEMLELFDTLVEWAYGEIGDDGETWKQGSKVYESWKDHMSYHSFFNDLMTTTGVMTEFVNGIFPEMPGLQSNDPEFARHRDELEARKNLGV